MRIGALFAVVSLVLASWTPGAWAQSKVRINWTAVTGAQSGLFMAQQERIEYERLSDSLGRLDLAVRTPDPATVVSLMQRLVPSYTPSPMLLAREDASPIRPPKVDGVPSPAPAVRIPAPARNGAGAHDKRALAGSIDAGD